MAQEITPVASPFATVGPSRLLRWSFFFAVLAFAWLRFSENTADNDLWGHVLCGQRYWTAGQVERVEKMSWTAAGGPWINHEFAADITLGRVHHFAGGTGLWCFMLAVAALTVGWAWREGAGKEPGRRLAAIALLGASVNFIALGYAVRPQLFTMLGLVAVLAGLRRFFAGRLAWGWLLPLVLAVWANLHGGFLAGWVLLILACSLEIAARIAPVSLRPLFAGDPIPSTTTRLGGDPSPCLPQPGTGIIAALAIASTAVLLLNPWGFDLIVWTVRSLRQSRPHITEWQPLLPNAASAPFYLVLVASALAWIFSRQPRRLWEAAALALLGAMSIQHQRHAPLFGLANLLLSPLHLADAARRLAPHCATLLAVFRRRPIQLAASLALAGAGWFCVRASVATPREHPFTMEVPRDTYPVAAIAFMRDHGLTGNTLAFFDWGQQMLWELPENPVSFDGRMDTVFPPALMEAHWRFYAGEAPGPALDLNGAGLALLPTECGGVDFLRRSGWALVYRDPLATILAKNPGTFAGLAPLKLPVLAGRAATQGRVPFPDSPPLLGTSAAPR